MVPYILVTYLLFLIFKISDSVFLDEPRLLTIDGHLYIYGANYKNVSFMISPKGYLNVNGENLYKVVRDAKEASTAFQSLKYTSLSKVEEDLNYVLLSMDQIVQRLNVCETLINNLQASSNGGGLPFQFQAKINKLERKVKIIIRNLRKRYCQKDPCLNGGTCLDRYLDFECRCAEGWEGKACERDVNECAKFAGSDLGCQNGATCINKPGTYECVCAAGWYGLHCTRRTNDCSSGSSAELCGHGTCVTQTSGSRGFTCICDQGWKTDGVNPACTVDVDECERSPCSSNPLVTCINTPGNFFCGQCPPGYSGNGFACSDVNECLVQNGGCSVQPMVQCINTQGSSTCGPCPPGYAGDGKSCTFVGKCQVDNGGCNPNARCQELGSNIQCQCLPGYTGSGIGPFGCELTSSGDKNPCWPNPCKNGARCYTTEGNNFTCSCTAGYTGRTCSKAENPCISNPCQNGGTCISTRFFFTCRCTSLYFGKYCHKERQGCGGYLTTNEGELQFPPANSSSIKYSHNLNCAWIIIVDSSMVINATFEYFDLESAPDCQMDWVQIHDGKSAGDHIIGKFCGRGLPNNGTIISSTNYMYMWFKSDSSKSGTGFKLSWKAVPPVCGGAVNASIHGTIRSPGSPGKYPPNRDCIWLVTAPPGKRITFTFFEVYIETHQNCSYDYLEFREALTLDSPLLARYCNTTIPQPLTTPGNTALVYFHSDQYQSDRGFQIAYHSVPGYPGCGGIYTSRRGEISPPMEEGRYIKNMDCAWLIKLTGDLRIQIEFLSFRLENDNNCNTDFVEVREGSDVTAPLIGRYCGSTLPPVIESEGNVLFVRFYSDNTIESTGFRLSYKSICRGVYAEETGVIKSPGYPNKYRSQDECVYIIQQPLGKIIHLEFQDFEFESVTSVACFYDYIEIRDGHSENSPLIKKFCGNERPSPITSTHNFLWIKMVTDKDVEMKGFYANYTTIDVSCGGILTAPEGEISSPSESGSYPPNHECKWVIGGKRGEIIQLTFTTFKLEFQQRCEFDYVAVYDNSSSIVGGGLIGKYCGESIPPLLTTTGNLMTIFFHSDTTLSMEGFTASYKLINVSTTCGGNFYTNMGSISSPNYPNAYPNSKTCVWTIRVDYGNKIALDVGFFSLEANIEAITGQCKFDYLEIRDGGYESSPLIGRYCGTKIPKRIISQSNSLYLKFKSDDTFPSLGFFFTWDGTITGCGGTLTAVTGSIISPNYPEPYGQNSLCNYKILVAMGSKITLNFMELDLENSGTCDSDYVEVFDGSDRSGKSLGKFCSVTNHPASLTSTRNQVAIKFHSDASIGGKGFYIKYKTECNTTLTGFRGVIESPNFPGKFPRGTNCTWVIVASEGNKVNISFSDFNLLGSCESNYIEIQEGNPNPTNTIGKYCRGKRPPTIASNLNRVYMKLVSSPLGLAGSFRAEWVLNGCGGTYIKNTGEFKSPNYPNIYPPNTLCEYFITVDPSLSITLTINDINFEALKDCFGDSLEVYGGADSSAPLLTKLCQKTSKPILIETSGNEMYVKFQSDQVTGGKGFSAKYFTKPSACGGERISNHGSITSRNYPKNYNTMDNCVWNIQVDSNHKIRLNFEEFDLASEKNCSDTYLEIFDGPSRNFPLLLKHCGNTIPSPNPIHSSSNFLTIHMRTGSGYTAKGFKATYELDCGAVITAYEKGVISPSDYLLTRLSFDNCSWTITSPQPDGHIILTISLFGSGTEYCTSNSLYVYDGDSHNDTLLGAYCGRKTYLPIVSKGNTVFLELYQHPYGNVNFWATYSSESSACGGILVGESGSFASPGYPNTYPSNAECVWSFQTAPGNKVEFNFREFDIEESEHCNEEYVEIREKDAAGKVLGVYCGQTLPANLTAQSSTWLKFRSGKFGTGRKGFLADYNLVYSNELTGLFGEIASPFYPIPYNNYLQGITWRITVDFGYAVEIKFDELHLDDFYTVTCVSSVTIYDGYDETAPKLLEVCGMVKPDAVTSSSNVVYIAFSHSQVHHGSLFLLKWAQVAKPGNLIQSTISSNDTQCRGIIDMSSRNNSITLTNPNWPDENSGNLECEWTVLCPDYYHLIMKVNVLITVQYPQCSYAYLGVSSKENGEWREMRKFCLSNETNSRVSTSNSMKIFFTTTYSDRSLFSVSVHRECGNSIRKPNGVIKLQWGNYSHRDWWSEEFCHWDITVSPGKKIKVVFTEFDFSKSSDGFCTDKYIMLRNGGSEDSPLLGQGVFCTFPTIIPPTTSNKLYIKSTTPFHHSGKTSMGVPLAGRSSFVLRFEEVSPDCGSRILLDENFNRTIISSPNYPNIPPSRIECVWTFVTAGQHRLQVDFLDRFDLKSTPRCDEEYVEVRDGGTLLSEELGRFCTSKPGTVKSTGNMIFIKYYTNATNPKNGFKAQVSIARCGGTIRSASGFLTSPGYPYNYPYDEDCEWTIETNPRGKTQVSFEDLDLPINGSVTGGSDSVKNSERKNVVRPWQTGAAPANGTKTNCTSSAFILLEEPLPSQGTLDSISLRNSFFDYIMQQLDKRQRRNVRLGYVCRNESVAPIRSSTNKMIIRFRGGPPPSNHINAPPVRGFKLKFSSVGKGCFHVLDTPSGVITSPGYPNESPNYYTCVWRISVPKGRSVTLTVNDLDLVNNPSDQRVVLFQDHLYRSRIALLTGSSSPETTYRSTSNLMLVFYRSKALSGTGKRGFKFTYDSNEPRVCGGDLTTKEGTIASPANQTSFFCTWESQFLPPTAENQTVAFYIKDAKIGNRTGRCSMRAAGVLDIFAATGSYYMDQNFCGNVSYQIVAIPVSRIVVTAIQDPLSGPVSFNVSYKTFACGGIIEDSETIITSPLYPNNYSPSTDCAWLISGAFGSSIKVTFDEFNLQPSCDDYLLIKNGPSPRSPLIGRYCGTSTSGIAPIVSEGSALFLQFHSDSSTQGKGFKLTVSGGDFICGGTIHSTRYILMSPNFPSEYDINQECEWEIVSAEGTHIGLVFVERFHVESSENCQNDFVKVFDYVRNEWKLIKTLCGRELPAPVNSTSNRLKVLFRSNPAVVSDGFKARWYQNCGGTLTSHSGVILSPGYPDQYRGNLDCTYIIDHNTDTTILNFTYFNLEPPSNGVCQYDSVKIYEAKWSNGYEMVGIFCGGTTPSPRTLEGKIKIQFVTDSNNNYGGFAINFRSTKCGSYVNESTTIEYYIHPLMTTIDYGQCEWEIMAPPDKIVVLRFEDVHMPFTLECSYPYVDVFDERKNGSVRLGRVCGRLKPRQVIIKSTTNKMTVKLRKGFQEGEGFSATVYFAYGSAAGCGGEISLDSKPQTIKSPDVNGDGYYEESTDCTWIIRAKPFHRIVANFKNFDVHPCPKVVQINYTDSSCTCDYVELRDGASHQSEVLLRTCGSDIYPLPVVSSGSVLTLQFSTDQTYNARGFSIEFSSALSQCGAEILTPKEQIQSLTSPNFPQNYPEGARCKWTIFDSSTDSNRVIHIHVTEWDITDTENCEEDYMSIEDTGFFRPLYQISDYEVSPDKTAGTAEIIRGNQVYMYFHDKSLSNGKMKFCGKGKSIDYYSASNEVTVGFSATSGINKKGFKVEYSIAGCTRNYTGEQGRIMNLNFKNDSHCYITIIAPSPNHTISMYFSSFWIKGSPNEECAYSYLEVRDGPDVKSPLIGKYCGYANPNSIFSNGQYLWLHFYIQTVNYGTDYQNVDVTYTTTDKGKGCGGRFFGLSGIVSSPGYPTNTRKNSQCRWDISIPTGLEEVLQFSAFDIGPANTCNTDYIEFYEVIDETETLLSRFCGKDTPALIRSTADAIFIKYISSVHNGGTGWLLEFKSVPPGLKVV